MNPSSQCRPLIFAAATMALTLSGCKREVAAPTPTPTVQISAPPDATPTPRPTPTPLPTAKPKAKGIALYKVKTSRKVFALTFDDGPDPTWTPKVLAILKKKNAPATFFMVGKMVRAHGSTGKLVVAAGHPIGGHTWTHPKRTGSPVMEIDRTDAMIQSELGITHRLFRPPYGIRNNGLARVASERGEDVILWSSDSADWNHNTSAARIHANVLRNLAPGGIALMHDGGGNRAQTVAALPNLIDAIRNRGYKLVTVPEILAMGAPEKAAIGGASAKKHG